jgi:(p)ppGpp synthase/HD superfamily hydrolase
MKSAKLFAEFHHTFLTNTGEPQLYGHAPYIIHLEAVVTILRAFGFTDREWIDAGYLHDVFEDTEAKFITVEKHFGTRVANLVEAVSGFGKTRKDRNAMVYANIAKMPDAAILKVADRIANTNSPDLLGMYLKERDDFHQHVARFAPEAMQERLVANYNQGA